jgi:hypothetical protein
MVLKKSALSREWFSLDCLTGIVHLGRPAFTFRVRTVVALEAFALMPHTRLAHSAAGARCGLPTS